MVDTRIVRRVLVIDDSPATRSLISQLLAQEGWSVECAQDAEHGAAMALNCPPDAIVSDLWMPGLSGLQLCRLLRDAPETTDVPLVLLTAAGDR